MIKRLISEYVLILSAVKQYDKSPNAEDVLLEHINSKLNKSSS